MEQSVLAVCSSPRTNSNSLIMASGILRGAAGLGASVELVRTSALKVAPCGACNMCRNGRHGVCVHQDDMVPLLDKVLRATSLVFASPICFASMNAQMKVFVDRLYALFGGELGWDALKGKRCALAFSYFNRDPLLSGPINALRTFQDMFFDLGVTLVGWVHAASSAAGEVSSMHDIMREAEELGQKLVGSKGANGVSCASALLAQGTAACWRQ